MTDDDTLEIRCRVRNTGNVTGKEIVQLYVKNAPMEVQRPIRELRGFAKVELAPGEEKELSFTLSKRDFAYYSILDRYESLHLCG